MNIAFRINLNIDTLTYQYITTRLNENKFGTYFSEIYDIIDSVLKNKEKYSNIKFIGIHFHIDSQF